MLFSALADKYLEDSIRPDVEKLLKLKMETPEIGTGKRIDSINEYLDRNIERIKQTVKTLPEEPKTSWEELDRIFLSLLGKMSFS